MEIYSLEGFIYEYNKLSDYVKSTAKYENVDLHNAVLLKFKQFERLLIFRDNEQNKS